MNVPKWGFGSAPLKPEVYDKRCYAIHDMLNLLQDAYVEKSAICESISTIKGLLNRIVKQDQWDWFTVYMYFDYPTAAECSKFVNLLSKLRKALLDDDIPIIADIEYELTKSNFRTYLMNFLSFDPNENSDEYIYILSRREDKEVLKIGMTSRNVMQRVKEINSATGIVFPLSPRAVFRVCDGRQAEKICHQALAEYRLRDDREFFMLPFKEAHSILQQALSENNLLFYKY